MLCTPQPWTRDCNLISWSRETCRKSRLLLPKREHPSPSPRPCIQPLPTKHCPRAGPCCCQVQADAWGKQGTGLPQTHQDHTPPASLEPARQAELLLASPSCFSSLPSTAELKQQQTIPASSLGSIRELGLGGLLSAHSPQELLRWERWEGEGNSGQVPDGLRHLERTSTFLHPLPSHSTLPAASHARSEPPGPSASQG